MLREAPRLPDPDPRGLDEKILPVEAQNNLDWDLSAGS
jgi:hypothetical protein